VSELLPQNYRIAFEEKEMIFSDDYETCNSILKSRTAWELLLNFFPFGTTLSEEYGITENLCPNLTFFQGWELSKEMQNVVTVTRCCEEILLFGLQREFPIEVSQIITHFYLDSIAGDATLFLSTLSLDQSISTTNVFVGNLAAHLTEEHFVELIRLQCGGLQLEKVVIIRDKVSGRSKGFGFLTFRKISDVRKALPLHGFDFEGTTLILDKISFLNKKT